MPFNKNIYWNNEYVSGISNKWSWVVNIEFSNGEGSNLGDNETDLLMRRIYSIGSMPMKEMKLINTYQGGIRMTHPGRVYYNGDLEFQFHEDYKFSVSKIFNACLDSRFVNPTIMDEDYPYKEGNNGIDKIVVNFYDTTNAKFVFKFVFYDCWVKEFEYLNNLETKNEEENLKCKATIKYNYYECYAWYTEDIESAIRARVNDEIRKETSLDDSYLKKQSDITKAGYDSYNRTQNFKKKGVLGYLDN